MNIKLVMLLMVAGFNSGHAIAKDIFLVSGAENKKMSQHSLYD